ncbi:hypothetical protein GCM10022221_46180 [Actinocorallia aurea]
MTSPASGSHSQIADALNLRIADGVYAPGAKLPSESALRAEFGVTRGTVRRALSLLERAGLVVVTPGTGRTVRHPDDPAAPPAPAYRRIADALHRQILDGTLPPGALLPSESALMAAHRVSRSTARQALATLEGTGLIRTHPGKGRYVRHS